MPQLMQIYEIIIICYSTLSKRCRMQTCLYNDIRLLKECAQNMSVRRSLKNGAGRIL